MSTILVAVIIITIAVIPTVIFIRLHKRREKERHTARSHLFQNAGIKHELSFTHQEMLKDKMLGLDSNNQSLLQFAFDTNEEIVVNLADVEACTLYKEYYQVPVSDSKDAKAEQVLGQMGLKIKFSNIDPSLLIAFYNNHIDGPYELPELEKKAKKWESLISILMPLKITQRA